MPSLTVENYLKAILQVALRDEKEWVTTGNLASALGVQPGTVTSMLKTLAESGLAEYRPYEGARLTDAGRTLAVRMVRRHRLIEVFLVQTLGLTWDQVHDEAENMEHAVSEFLVDRIDAYLGHPTNDPHGDPIPTADGAMRGTGEASVPLHECPVGSRVRIVRVINQGTDFLRYLSEAGIALGTEGSVTANNREADVLSLELEEGRRLTMGHKAAGQLLAETCDSQGKRGACAP
ncbi:MAG: DtxR family iron (metal) dependent repressor [Planctomycetaceae bacterium]|nr:DtxR family iron (metal) dependent repressor [Planctomycetaceae bacterium]